MLGFCVSKIEPWMSAFTGSTLSLWASGFQGLNPRFLGAALSLWVSGFLGLNPGFLGLSPVSFGLWVSVTLKFNSGVLGFWVQHCLSGSLGFAVSTLAPWVSGVQHCLSGSQGFWG